MALKNLDPDQITISIAGIPLEGFADGEFITISFESNSFDDVVGSDGEVTRSKSNDRRATVTVKLMQSSDSNDLLSALYNTDLKAPNGAGVGVLSVTDLQGRSVFIASEAWIMKAPDVSYDRTATDLEWTIRCADLQWFAGGN